MIIRTPILLVCLILTTAYVKAQQKMPFQTPSDLIQKAHEAGAVLQQGTVMGYETYFVSQPKGELPDLAASESTLNLILQIRPPSSSQIKFVNINFIKDNSIYPPCLYKNGVGYATKPLSHFSLIMDVLKTKLARGYSGNPMTIQFLTGAPSGDILSIQ